MAKLTVIYTDGTRSAFLPSHEVLANADGKQAILGWGQALEFRFDIDDRESNLTPLESELEVVGYYERLDLRKLVGLSSHSIRGTEKAADTARDNAFCPKPGD